MGQSGPVNSSPPTPTKEQPKLPKRKDISLGTPPRQPRLPSPFESGPLIPRPPPLTLPTNRASAVQPQNAFQQLQATMGALPRSMSRRGGSKRNKSKKQKRKTRKHGRRK
jgi:hypothetical protein